MSLFFPLFFCKHVVQDVDQTQQEKQNNKQKQQIFSFSHEKSVFIDSHLQRWK